MIHLPPPAIERPAIIQQVGHDIAPDRKFAIAFAPGFRRPANSPATLAFQGSTNYPSDGQTVTFTAVAIGAAASNRYVFVSIPYYNGTLNSYSIASVTIGGVLATIHTQPFQTAANSYGGVALVSALVPTGTTADIVITWAASGASFYRPRIGVYRVTGLQSNTPFAIVTDTQVVSSANMPHSKSINVTKGGIVIVAGYTNNNTHSLSGLTQDFNVTPYGTSQFFGGSATVSATGTITATLSGGSGGVAMCMAMGSFR